MSLRAMLWALEDAPATDATALLILWALADRAADDGRAAYPSVDWIAERARCSTRTVHRHLRTLEDAGLIRRGDQELVAHFRADHRPVVWDLNLDISRGDNLSRGDTGGSHGVTPVTERGDTVVTQTVPLPTGETVPVTTPVVPAAQPDRFEDFWATYPRRVGKVAAVKAWAKALKRATADQIIAGAERYRDDPTRTPQYTAHPQTWLNAGRWDDEVTPAKQDDGYSDHWANGGSFR